MHFPLVCVVVFTHSMQEFKAWRQAEISLQYDSNQIFHWGETRPLFLQRVFALCVSFQSVR